ncbi:MAG: T9SS type A sorting domain-containing protein [Bacteroidales bacterium]|nr:T9SS type A sorting domain-containing protein [Bacteroidales bacterium]MBN2764216.1 T9SS type A sorting domain-containing protein [Bacteroidales bacterium]
MKIIICIALLLYVIPYSFSQTASSDIVSASGSSIVAEDFVMSWAIGENIIDFCQDQSVTNVNTDIQSELVMQNGTLIKIYPTLTKEYIYVTVNGESESNLQAELVDLKGNVLKSVSLSTSLVEINIGDFTYGTYILRVYDSDYNDYETVKIIRH